VGGYLKIIKIEIKNFKSLKNVTIVPNNILALVGQNNSGKSNVLKALEFFFKASTNLINEDSFYNHDFEEHISIFITFHHLSEWEIEKFEPFINNNKLIVGRRVNLEDNSYKINNFVLLEVPEQEWLQTGEVSGTKITEWWRIKDNLIVEGLDFGKELGTTKPTVGIWKEKIDEFIVTNRKKIPWKNIELKNPTGLDGALKGALPEFIFIPAVRDISEEAKVSKNNPFGSLINSMIDKISSSKLEDVSTDLEEIGDKLNKKGGEKRISEIGDIEEKLTDLISEFMECEVEIEIPMPKINDIFNKAKIYADDGIRTSIETKGHGMQRYMIFTILRAYVEILHFKKAEDRANERSTIFAIEEPELYLHPQSQRTLMSVLKDIANGPDQVIYCTHSNLFVDIGFFDNICILKRIKDGVSYHSIPTQLQVKNLLDDLKVRGIDGTEEGIRNQYLNAFNSRINEGFFAKKVVIVEGASECYMLPIYAHLLGLNLDKNDISVVHSHGKGPMDRLLRIFNGFNIPIYLWFDGDKDGEKDAKATTLKLLELVGDPISKIEDIETKVSSNYAVLEFNLERTSQDEIDNFDDFYDGASTVLGPVGKPLRHKFVAEKIAKMVEGGEKPEEVVPNTIIEIIDKIKNLSYSGSVLKE